MAQQQAKIIPPAVNILGTIFLYLICLNILVSNFIYVGFMTDFYATDYLHAELKLIGFLAALILLYLSGSFWLFDSGRVYYICLFGAALASWYMRDRPTRLMYAVTGGVFLLIRLICFLFRKNLRLLLTAVDSLILMIAGLAVSSYGAFEDEGLFTQFAQAFGVRGVLHVLDQPERIVLYAFVLWTVLILYLKKLCDENLLPSNPVPDSWLPPVLKRGRKNE